MQTSKEGCRYEVVSRTTVSVWGWIHLSDNGTLQGFQQHTPLCPRWMAYPLWNLVYFSVELVRSSNKNVMKCEVNALGWYAISAKWLDFKNPKVEASAYYDMTFVSSPTSLLKLSMIMVGSKSVGRIRVGWNHEGEAILIIMSHEKKVISLFPSVFFSSFPSTLD